MVRHPAATRIARVGLTLLGAALLPLACRPPSCTKWDAERDPPRGSPGNSELVDMRTAISVCRRDLQPPGICAQRTAHGASRIVALRDSRRPGLAAASGQSRWPPGRRSRGAALTLTLNTAGPRRR